MANLRDLTPENIPPVPKRRAGTSGAALLTTLASMIILFSILALLQAESMANMTLLASARRSIERHALEDSAYDILRSIAGQGMTLGDAASKQMFSGNAFSVPVVGKKVSVSLQDVEGIPDLARDPIDVLALVPEVGALVAEEVRARRSSGGVDVRFPTVASFLASVGLSFDDIAQWAPFYSLDGKAEGLRSETAPSLLLKPDGNSAIAPVFGQVAGVLVRFRHPE